MTDISTTDVALQVGVASETDRNDWDAYVRADAGRFGSTGYHDWRWRWVIGQTFNHEPVYLIARDAARSVAGVLPMVFINSRIFGRTLTSMPFLNYGGVAAESEPVARALIARARHEARIRHCRSAELRHMARRFPDLPCKQHKVTMRLPLTDVTWEALDRKVRNQVRKAEKSGLQVEVGGSELVSAFYAVFSRNMRDLGTPVYPRRLFDLVTSTFPERTQIVLVRHAGQPVAAALTYRTDAMVEVPWASSIRDFNALCPNHLMYWHIIQSERDQGVAVLDFGRSTPGEGTYKFKEQWGATPMALTWEYCYLAGDTVPDASPANPKYRRAIELWKRCPLWLANSIGPSIVGSIP